MRTSKKFLIENVKKKISIKKFICIIILITASIVTCIIAKINNSKNELDLWIGRYLYAETFQHFDGKRNFDIHYEIIIYKDEDKYYAELIGDGWFGWSLQSRTLAYITGSEQAIYIFFNQTLPGDDLYGKKTRYEPDELLLSLSYNEENLQSEWHKLQQEHPFLDENNKKIKGKYFIKID